MSVPFAFLAVVLIWSTTPLAIKWSGEGPGYLFGVFSRMALAVVLCLALLMVLRQQLPWHREARRAYLSGALGAFGGMLCVYWAAQHLPSGLIAVIFAMAPLVTAVLARPLLNERALSLFQLGGLALSIGGLVVIFGAGLLNGRNMIAGLAVQLLSVFLHSLSLVLVKRYGDGLPSLSITTGALLIAVPLFFIAWLVLDGHAPRALPVRAAASIVYLGVVGSVIGFTLYFYVLKRMQANSASLITLITPVTALMVGNAFNGERISARVLAGTVLVLAGLALHQWGDRLRRRRERVADPGIP
jgi:drug/metabolite transporter (DMT)-like permease